MPDRLAASEQSVPPPGPPSVPLVPGHLGTPSYGELAQMAAILGVLEAVGRTLLDASPDVQWHIGPWEDRLRTWVRGEVERGNIDKLVEACRS